MSLCTGITSKLREAFASGGKNGSPDSKSHNSSLTLVWPPTSLILSFPASLLWHSASPQLLGLRLMLEVGFVYYATYNYYADKFFPSLPHVGTCGGEEFAAFTGCATLSSYLVLFISFYAATYKKASRKDRRSTIAMSTSIPSDAVHELERKKMPTMMETSETAVDALHCAEELMKAAGTSIVSTSHDLHLLGGGKK